MFFFGNKEKKDRETDKIYLNLIKKLSICKEYFFKIERFKLLNLLLYHDII